MVSSGLQDNSNDNWFYIRSIATGHVISCLSSKESLLRSQVYVCPLQTPNDNSLWKWEKTFLKNKATGLVLDIRKGRLRMMEDTEICLYNQKTEDESRNQQWGLRESIDDLGRKQKGTFIYSMYNQEWVLDVGQIDDQKGFNKLILFPSQTIDNDNQRWLIEYQSLSPLHHDEINNHHHHNDLFLSNTTLSSPSNSFIIDHQQQKQPSPTAVDAQSYHEFSTSSRSSSSADLSGLNFPYGLMPAKRGSQSSVNSLTNYKESHHMVYIQQNQSLR
ncbi:hypothetical protein BJ944DRAFT_172418 [Cunninghamella echinulata]|nr:hypothetical protein BJ944DRAFT_172418 [Cunninghamella echinulata]